MPGPLAVPSDPGGEFLQDILTILGYFSPLSHRAAGSTKRCRRVGLSMGRTVCRSVINEVVRVQASFLNQAGCRAQLFALQPGRGPSFLGFLSLLGLHGAKLFQGRRTRLMLIVRARRTEIARADQHP
jgi:hypothetical protein